MKFLLAYSAWLMLSGVVALAARRLGRSGGTWFLLAIIISPLLAGLALLVVSRDMLRDGRKAARKEPDFEPDGVYAGIPYKVADNAVIVAQMPHGVVRFPTMEQFLAAATAKIA